MHRWLAFLIPALLSAAQLWHIRVEEPTGLEPRFGDLVRVPLARLAGNRTGFHVTDSAGRDVTWQVSGDALLFPASLRPGDLPVYRVYCCASERPAFEPVHYRRIGMRRIEFGNARFRITYDTGLGAIVEAYSLTAGPQRVLNLVETTPPDSGWSAAGLKGPVSSIDDSGVGPVEGHVRLTREGGVEEFIWSRDSGGFRWKAAGGFRFQAVSAAPYVPFDRYLDTPETVLWPDTDSTTEPGSHDIGARPAKRLPAGHAVYYQLAENYGALGIVALDPNLDFQGIGSARFTATRAGAAEIGVTFPRWAGFRTLLEARRENRIFRNPLIARVSGPEQAPMPPPAPALPKQVFRPNAPAAAPFREQALDLNGDWELAFTGKGAEMPTAGFRKVTVPGSVHIQWLGAAEAMSHSAEWISYKEWWYRKRFRVPAAMRDKRLRLKFEATDYYADTWVNGQFVGRHEGYIDPYEYDTTAAMRADGDNEIVVRVWTPVTYYWRHRPYTVKGSYGAVDQKPDDITALGITRPVKLIASGAAVIRDVAVNTRLTGANTAAVDVDLDASAGAAHWELTLSPRNFVSPMRLRVSGPTTLGHFTIPVDNPQLWWTWDHGKPNLYTLDVRLLDAAGQVVDARTLAVGIREIEKIGWDFYLNRKRLFIRGTNYYYNLFMSEMNRSRYARDMDLMLAMNVNMIRLHCHYSNPEFYDLTDERGVLLWQDYLEAWYPEDTAFSLQAARLYDPHIRYARNHPSVAIWAASDEESLENYRDLTKHLAPRPAFLDPQRRAVVRSTGRYGDSHVYHGWYNGSIWEYADLTDPFVSELGATSLPNYETLVQFMGDRWPIRDHESEWIWRKLQIPEAMRAWGDPGSKTMREYIPETQAYTSRLFQIALERARRLKHQGVGGILHFHAIDIWPSVTMAAIDINRTPTKTFETVARSFAPVAANFEYRQDRWKMGETMRCGLWAINDLWDSRAVRVDWKITPGGAAGSYRAQLGPDSAVKLGDVEWKPARAGSYQLTAAVVGGDERRISENVFEFVVAP